MSDGKMSKQIDRPPLHVRPRPSARLAGYLLVVHAAALAVVAGLPLDGLTRVTLAGVVLLGLTYSATAHLLYLLPWAVREAVWGPDGGWRLTLVSGRELEPKLLASTYVGVSLVVLNFRCARFWPCALVLAADSLGEDLLRRLRVRLRLEGGAVFGGTGSGTDGSLVGKCEEKRE
jgi:hypothetical protein